MITKEGDTKIRQYGQWDGYPDGQGVEILKYLIGADLEKYQENLAKIPEITDEQIDDVNKLKNPFEKYPYLSRDCGSNIHQMIEDGEVEFVQHTSEEEAKTRCKGFYTIDFQKNVFTTDYYGVSRSYNLNNLPTVDQYLVDTKENEDEEE